MTSGYGSPAPKKHLPLLTGLRGLAAAIVFISHAAIIGFLPSVVGHGFGQVGVMIFFVLSGFLMAHLYIEREPNWQNVSGYAKARIGRVVPLYLMLVLVSVVISNFIYGDFRYALSLDDPAVILQALFFVQAPFELWTIPVEVQFYVLFVLAWVLYHKFGRTALFLIAALISIPAIVYIGLFQERPSILPTYGYSFFLGAITAVFLPKIQKLLAGRVPALVGIAFLVLLFVNLPELRNQLGLSIAPGQGFISTWLDPITWLIVYGLFVCCLLALPSLRFLDLPPFIFLGEISYGLYLLHYPILEIVGRQLGTSLPALLVGIVVSVGLAWLSYVFFERPTLGFIRGTRRRSTAGDASRHG